MAGAARHEQEDDRLRLRGLLRRFGRQRIRLMVAALIRRAQHVRHREGTEAAESVGTGIRGGCGWDWNVPALFELLIHVQKAFRFNMASANCSRAFPLRPLSSLAGTQCGFQFIGLRRTACRQPIGKLHLPFGFGARFPQQAFAKDASPVRSRSRRSATPEPAEHACSTSRRGQLISMSGESNTCMNGSSRLRLAIR